MLLFLCVLQKMSFRISHGQLLSFIALALAAVGADAVPDPWSCPRPSIQGIWQYIKVRFIKHPR